MNRRRVSRLIPAIGALLAGGLALGAVPAGTAAASPERTTVVVRFASGSDPAASARELAGRSGTVRFVYRNVMNGAAITVPAAAVPGIARNPRVEAVVADARVQLANTQTNATWGLDRTDQRALPLSGTYTAAHHGGGVTAYVIDTGIRRDHVDFGGRVAAGYTAISDGRGTEDCNGHGTHVAGTVGGTTWGMAKGVTLVPVRVLDCNGSGTSSGVIAGLDWVVAHHAAGVPAVANMSLGGGASSTLDSAVTKVINDGVAMVVAAGNDNKDACNSSPARVTAALTVGATDSTDTRASFSNFGTCLDLFAPGVNITSAWHTGTTTTNRISGTSMAAPHVAGAAAVLLGQTPSLTPSQVHDHLNSAATAGVVKTAGTGSANRLLFSDPNGGSTAPAPAPATAPAAPTNVTAKAGKRSASVSWTKGSDGGSALTGQTIHVYTGTKKVSTVSVSASATSATVSGLTAGTSYSFSVTATNAVGTSPESARSNAVTPTR